MDVASAESIRVLECIAACNEELISLSQWLHSFADIKPSRGFDCRAYESGTMLEAYVEAELDGGKTICWWLDVKWRAQEWSIQSSVSLNDDQGQRVLKNFPDKTPQTLDDLIKQLQEAASDLAAYARSMDLNPSSI